MAVLSTHVEEQHVAKLSTSDHDFPLVALWDFTTKTAKDLTGNGNDGILIGNAKFVQIDPL